MEKNKIPLVPEDDSFLDIDKYALDREWVEQPKLYMQFARKLAKATRTCAEASANLKLAYAQCGERIREDPEAYGLRKATEAAVEEKIYTMAAYQQAVVADAKAKYNLTLLRGTCDAVEQRKTGLEQLVKLHLAGYFSEPKADEEDRELVDTMAKRAIRSKGRK